MLGAAFATGVAVGAAAVLTTQGAVVPSAQALALVITVLELGDCGVLSLWDARSLVHALACSFWGLVPCLVVWRSLGAVLRIGCAAGGLVSCVPLLGQLFF